MTKLHRHYYVGLLSAAELHGAAHQRPQVFQVMVDKAVADRDFGRVKLRFFTKKDAARMPVVLRNSATGRVPASTPEVTALDLAARPNDSGGLSNVATIVAELAEERTLHPDVLTQAVTLFPAAAVRRLGWLLDRVIDYADATELTAVLAQYLAGQPAPKRAVDRLDPAGPRRGTANNRWHIVENADVEPDL
jgi:predicted transcriptional regulator of viral defense system